MVALEVPSRAPSLANPAAVPVRLKVSEVMLIDELPEALPTLASDVPADIVTLPLASSVRPPRASMLDSTIEISPLSQHPSLQES